MSSERCDKLLARRVARDEGAVQAGVPISFIAMLAGPSGAGRGSDEFSKSAEATLVLPLLVQAPHETEFRTYAARLAGSIGSFRVGVLCFVRPGLSFVLWVGRLRRSLWC